MLGKFEEMTLLSLLRAGPKSPASAVFEVLTDRLGKEKSFGALYTTLDRLVDKKFVKVVSEPSGSGKAKTRRLFTITGAGQRVLSQSLQSTKHMAEGLAIPGLVGGV
jgi:DNA-binding PadR family transcriptional regulator